MNKTLKSALALALVALIALSVASCAKHKKTEIDLSKFPLVFADKNGLEAISEGETEPTVITKNFYTFLNAEKKVQAASNGKIYYLETKDRKTIIGDLYSYDVTTKESELVHSGVFSYKVSHDGECIIISDGTGGIFKYDKKHEKKNDYQPIQSSGVSAVLDISADGKYVLYSQVLEATNYYTLTIARTDFETTDEIEAQKLETRLENKNINKAPVIIAQNYKEYIGSADDLSVIYYTQNNEGKDSVPSLCAFKNYKQTLVLAESDYENYFVNSSGEMLFSESAKNTKKIADIVTDKYADADAKLKKDKASKKDWKAKTARDNIRDKINTYLENITTTTFYKFDKNSKEPEVVVELSGQLLEKGVDSSVGAVFFGTTRYDFSAAEKPDINKVSVAYKLFDAIKSRSFSFVGFDGVKDLAIDENTEYNSGDCYVDTAAGKVNVIMNFDYLKSKVGSLYTVGYTEGGFGEAKLISDKAAKTVHFDSGDDIYFVTADNSLVKNDEKTVLLKDYGFSSDNGSAKVAFTSVSTGEKNKYGKEITEDTAYLISGDKALKLGKIFTDKPITVKGDMLAFYTSFDYKESSGDVVVYNGNEAVKLTSPVSMIYKFS